jgi:hypothetical protein
MENDNPLIDKLVYLDIEYISLKYEEITKNPPVSTFTKTEGGKVGIGIPFINAGVHTYESRTYSLSSVAMLKKVYKELGKYKPFVPKEFKNSKGSSIFWIDGSLTLGRWTDRETGDTSCELFEIYQGKHHVSLLTKNDYFYPGFASMLAMDRVLKFNIDIPVRTLAKVLYYADPCKSFVAAPFIIFEIVGQ